MDERRKLQSPKQETRARNRFLVISAMRLAGVVMILLGIAIYVKGAFDLPDWIGLLMIFLGMGEAFIVPTMLSRIWSTNDRP